SEPPFASEVSDVLASAFGAAFLAGDLVAGALVAGAFLAAALLASARRARVDVADRWSFAGRLSTTTVMWLVRLRIRNARPWARGRMRLAVGPSSAYTVATTRVVGSSPLLFWALAAALAITLATGSLAAWGAQRRMSSASVTDLPRTRSITRRA